MGEVRDASLREVGQVLCGLGELERIDWDVLGS